MARCPSGHESQTSDYCDTCGAVIAGAAPQSGKQPDPVAPEFPSAGSGGPAESAGGESCPQCGARRDGRFCEECGYDFDLAALVPAAGAGAALSAATGSGGSGPASNGSGSNGSGSAGSGGPDPGGAGPIVVENLAATAAYDPFAESALGTTQPYLAFDPDGHTAQQPVAAGAEPAAAAPPVLESEGPHGVAAAPAAGPIEPEPVAVPGVPPNPVGLPGLDGTGLPGLGADPGAPEPGEAGATPAPTPASVSAPATPSASASAAATATGTLVLDVNADLEYYTAGVERGDFDADEYPFPKYPQERRFEFQGERIRIGRPSASRGIAVEVDLTGPPLDPAVSHLHAQLLRGADGGWSVVDLHSSNGTRINGAADPITPETEHPVAVGDRIHLGVWTTLTVEQI